MSGKGGMGGGDATPLGGKGIDGRGEFFRRAGRGGKERMGMERKEWEFSYRGGREEKERTGMVRKGRERSLLSEGCKW